MKVKVIRPHLSDSGMRAIGDVLEVSLLRAKELEQGGLAVPLVTQSAIDALGNKGVADKSGPRPTLPPLSGGPTGEAIPALSSQAGLVRPKRKYTRRKAAPAS